MKNKIDLIIPLIENKKVLDIGSKGTRGFEIFDNITEYTKEITGLDLVYINNPDYKSNKVKGIICGNVEDVRIKKKFDVIIMGDVIEHLGNPLKALLNLKNNLKKNGKILITTPNIRSRYIFSRTRMKHTHWHDKKTLTELISRTGLKIEKIGYYCGNKLKYPFYLLPIIFNQGLYVIVKKCQ